MTRPRKALISLADTPYYHVTSRCVRRAFLCGVDHYSGKNYEHRRQWVVDRLRLLSSLFAIDVCAYAVMNNHYHLVLKMEPTQLEPLSDDEIMTRWCALFKGPLLVQRYRAGTPLTPPELATLREIVTLWRDKLCSISWFMRCLNQPIARQANLEDGCSGKFWECRFNSQALRTEEALLTCMAYVDLNPIRAEMAETLENSHYTSIKERVKPEFTLAEAISGQSREGDLLDYQSPLKPLLAFQGADCLADNSGIPCSYTAYLDLLDWTGRLLRPGKRGRIDPKLPSILVRLQISATRWCENSRDFERIHAQRFNRSPPLAAA